MKKALVLFGGMFILCVLGILGTASIAANSSVNDTIFIQIWVKRSEINELKSCKPGTHVRVERPNDEYYILPCRAVKEIQ